MSRFKSLVARAKAALKGSPGTDRVFLVVDDDVDARQTIIDYLHSFGYKQVIQATNGAQALEILAKESVDFIISDWEMPGADGLSLLRALKNDPKLRNIPFIMVTSPVSQERNKVENAAALKVDGYIVKPFRSQVLKEKINQAIAMANFRGRSGALVADDDKDTRDTIVEFLKALGFAPIYEAADGSEAFASLQLHSQEIAFVISDWEMPGVAGIDLLKRIRGDAVLSAMPFIMVTSQTSIERLKLEQALSAEVDNYLLKPFRIEDLRKKVELATAKSRGQAVVDRDLSRGEECLALFRWDEAMKIFALVLEKDADNVRAIVGTGVALRSLGTEKAVHKALQFFQKAITLNPRYDEAYVELALTYEDSKTVDQAIGILREALKFCTFSEKMHFHLGRMLLKKGLTHDGMEELQRALEIDPDFEEAKILLEGRKVE